MRKILPAEREGLTKRFKIRGQPAFYVTVNTGRDGQVGEVQIRNTKTGSRERTYLYALMDACSIGLQHGVPLSAYTKQWRGVQCEPRGLTDDKQYPMVASELDYIARWMDDRFGVNVTQ